MRVKRNKVDGSLSVQFNTKESREVRITLSAYPYWKRFDISKEVADILVRKLASKI